MQKVGIVGETWGGGGHGWARGIVTGHEGPYEHEQGHTCTWRVHMGMGCTWAYGDMGV